MNPSDNDNDCSAVSNGGPPQQSWETALECKARGNALFGTHEFERAANAYQEGLDALPPGKTTSDEDEDDLALALRSNLAMALIKLEEFDRAENECTGILDAHPPNTKVLYRRALAREGKSRRTNLPLDDQRKHYILAMDDLQRCLDLLDQEEKRNDADINNTLRTKRLAWAALERLERSYNNTLPEKKITRRNPKESPSPRSKQMPSSTNSDLPSAAPKDNPLSSSASTTEKREAIPDTNIHSNESTGSPPIAASDSSQKALVQPPVPPIQQQKQDVVRLLLARKNAGPTLNGEAFFLIEWTWWSHWCRQVDFFYNTKSIKGQEQLTAERVQRVLGLLPTGAVLPTWKSNEEDDSSSSDEGEDSPGEVLGVINNSTLLLDPQSIFDQQWYLNTTATASTTEKRTDSLRPNLVRGYHFELLPREVYNALRSWYGETTPSICRRTNSHGIISLYESSSTERNTAHPMTTKVLNIPKCSACRAPTALNRCKRCMAVQYCDRRCQEAHWPYHKVLCKQASANGTKLASDDSLSGKVGLNNLGNTCYMNSALQALSHATPLVRYFLSNRFKTDLNTTNPLGAGGKLAMAFDGLLKELWMRNKGSSLSPTVLKRVVAMFAPRFAGCLQHDAQEFLAYLLDGLHEDLNRLRNAPYVTMPDVTDGQNMAIAGAEAWDAYRRRNDSLVMDTFYGQFQSTCVCPQCQRVSVSFDAFNHVSLEIPQPQKVSMSIPVLVFPRSSNRSRPRPPYRYGITIRRQSCIADLKKAVSALTDIPVNNLTMADMYENTVYELLDDKKSVSTIRVNDITVAFEVNPYTNLSIHVVATQSLLVIDKNGKEQRPNFGFPIMTAFDANFTCRQVWDHMWGCVDHFVRQKGSDKDFVDARNRYRPKDILTIRIVDNRGHQVPLFSIAEGTTTSELPCDSDEELQVILGSDCTESFLFLSLEWKNPLAVDEEGEGGDAIMPTNAKPPIIIRPKSFAAFQDHSTMTELMEEERIRKKGNNAITLEHCFEAFTKPERLDDSNMWYCSKCKEHVRAMKTMKLWRLPNILVVHLKRFEFKHSLRRDKIDTPVVFPREGLDMSRHCSGLKEISGDISENVVDAKVDALYDLFAVVNHYGRMGFGHYTSYCRQWDESGVSTQWNLFDDSSVRLVDCSEVSGPSAYVLFYRRREFH